MTRAWIVLVVVLAACDTTTSRQLVIDNAVLSVERVVPWGEVGLRPGAFERPAQGPSAVAVDRLGRTLVLDRINRRVVSLERSGVRPLFTVAPDAELIAVAPDSAVAVYSPLRARIWMFGASGQPHGELAVPRILRDVHGFSLGGSRRISLRNSFQETFELGSPAVPLELPAMLATKHEGGFALADGRRCAARRLSDGAVEVLVHAPRGERAAAAVRHRLEERVTAVEVVGAAGQVVCLRLDRVEEREIISVRREALCLDARSGEEVLRRNLPAPGLYLPRQELALGGEPVTLTFIHPEERGLRVVAWQVSR